MGPIVNNQDEGDVDRCNSVTLLVALLLCSRFRLRIRGGRGGREYGGLIPISHVVCNITGSYGLFSPNFS